MKIWFNKVHDSRRTLVETDEPEIRERLLVERNRNWIPHIEKCLKSDEKCFVVVGAAHLVGPDSVVDLLQKAGYKVEQQ